MNIVKCDLKKFYEEKDNKNIIVFGASIEAKDFFRITFTENRILFFIDNNEEKQQGKVYINNSCFDVYPVERIKNSEYNNSIILIGSSMYDTEMLEQLSKMNAENICYLISDIAKTEYNTLKAMFIKKPLSAQEVDDTVGYLVGKNNPKPFCIPRLKLTVTTKCDLNCKHCRALIPYLDEHKNRSLEEICNDIDLIANNVDFIGVCELIGGEPLIYPHLAEVIDYAVAFDNIKYVYVTTNCTIIPDEKLLKSLQNPKVILMLSDYGLLDKMAKLVSVLEKNNIYFSIEKYEQWEDCGHGEFNGKSVDELKDKYKVCVSKHCGVKIATQIDNGKLYGCFFSERLEKKGLTLQNDYTEIFKDDTREEVQEKIRYYYEDVEYLEACNYCGQGERVSKKVKPAIQLVGKIEPSAYTIVNREEYNKLLRERKN